MAGAPKLIILSEQFRGRSFELTKDLHTVGRVDERDICIKDPTISTYHCAFVRNGSTYILKDQGSTNGTRVNNIPITEQELQNSDILQIGGVEILYDCDDKSVTTVMRTQTGINLEAGDIGTATIRRNTNAQSKDSKSAFTQKLVLLLILLLVLIILILLGVLAVTMFGQKPASSAGTVSQATACALRFFV